MNILHQLSAWQRRVAMHLLLDPSAFLAVPELLMALEKLAAPVACSRDRILFRQGQPCHAGIYVLHSGSAYMCLENAQGDELASASVERGSILGLPSFVSQASYSMTALATEGAQVCFIPGADFSALLLAQPALGVMALRVMAAETLSTRNALAMQLTCSLELEKHLLN